jgi:hypothetical protein
MYGRKANSELKQSELEEARRGFIQFLRRKRFSPQFITSHGDDLFATAALEYSRKVAEGEEIDSPAGWLSPAPGGGPRACLKQRAARRRSSRLTRPRRSRTSWAGPRRT